MQYTAPIATLGEDPAAKEREREAIEAAQKSQASSDNGIDPILLVFYLLLDASRISTQSAVLHAKQLNQNALSQQRLNGQAASLNWYTMPSNIKNHHSEVISHWHFTWKDGGIEYKTFKKVTWTTHPNSGAFNRAASKNQVVAAQRQLLSDKLTVMQQQSQINEGAVNSITDEASQALEEGSDFMQILESLTFQALLRHPVQS